MTWGLTGEHSTLFPACTTAGGSTGLSASTLPGVPQGMLTRTTSAPMLGSARAKDLPSKAFLLARTACCHHRRKPVPASRPHTSQAPPLVPWRTTTLGSTSEASQKPAPVLLTSNPNAPPGAVCNKVHEKKPS